MAFSCQWSRPFDKRFEQRDDEIVCGLGGWKLILTRCLKTTEYLFNMFG